MKTPLCPTAKQVLDELEGIPEEGLRKEQVAIIVQEICARMIAISTRPEPEKGPEKAPEKAPLKQQPKPPSASGQFCSKCGGEMVRTGTCLTCQGCGDTSGGCS